MSTIKILTLLDIDFIYPDGQFHMELWEKYIDKTIPSLKSLMLQDMKDTLACGYTFTRDYLPILNLAMNKAKRDEALISFEKVTKNINERIVEVIGRTVNATIILALGLCNGAGWVFEHENTQYILLGIEKIIELDWCDARSMYGLIYHELGHIYQNQYGVLERELSTNRDKYLWQLFTEGIAMVFEQRLIGDTNYFHQYDEEWKTWCRTHFGECVLDFHRDMNIMDFKNQCFFGDWVRYKGHGDVGYYIGAVFVQFILERYSWNIILSFTVEQVFQEWQFFLKKQSQDYS